MSPTSVPVRPGGTVEQVARIDVALLLAGIIVGPDTLDRLAWDRFAPPGDRMAALEAWDILTGTARHSATVDPFHRPCRTLSDCRRVRRRVRRLAAHVLAVHYDELGNHVSEVQLQRALMAMEAARANRPPLPAAELARIYRIARNPRRPRL